ncbi:hypothetical protein N431DRAFT_458673 [Stipitochalara longipes BDJ]|nr:hypothetical protein N431DRAFT_458673 [Stipitochalara longipes BDJ]
MASNSFTTYNAAELNRILSMLKDNKLTLSFKLNLIRSSVTSSLTHLSKFNTLEDQMVDFDQQIWMIEARLDQMKANPDEFDKETKSALKKAMELVGTLDVLGEDIMRFKFALESSPAGGINNTAQSAAAAGSQGGVFVASQVDLKPAMAALTPGNTISAASSEAPRSIAIDSSRTNYLRSFLDATCTPAAKKQKLNPAPNVQSPASTSKDDIFKQEPDAPKPAKIANWAPEGYYFVKAHFRRKPKRKDKQAETERKEDNAPASVEIVDLDGV